MTKKVKRDLPASLKFFRTALQCSLKTVMIRAGRKGQKDKNENRLHDDRNNDPAVTTVPGIPAGYTCLQHREGSLC